MHKSRCWQGEPFHLASLRNSSQLILIFSLQARLSFGSSASSPLRRYVSGSCWIFLSRPLRYFLHLSNISSQDHQLDCLLSCWLCIFHVPWWYDFYIAPANHFIMMLGWDCVDFGRCVYCSGRLRFCFLFFQVICKSELHLWFNAAEVSYRQLQGDLKELLEPAWTSNLTRRAAAIWPHALEFLPTRRRRLRSTLGPRWGGRGAGARRARGGRARVGRARGGRGGVAAVPAARAAAAAEGGGGRGEGSGAGAGTGGVAWRAEPPALPRRFQYILAYIITSEYIPQYCSLHPAKSQYIQYILYCTCNTADSTSCNFSIHHLIHPGTRQYIIQHQQNQLILWHYYTHYDKCHKGKQGVSYSHYDNIITLLWHYYDTIITSIITSIMTQQTIMTLLWHFYDTIMTILRQFYDDVITLLWQYYNTIITIFFALLLHYYDTIIIIMTGYLHPVYRNVQTAVFYLNIGKW